jgi:hypothetical protein
MQRTALRSAANLLEALVAELSTTATRPSANGAPHTSQATPWENARQTIHSSDESNRPRWVAPSALRVFICANTWGVAPGCHSAGPLALQPPASTRRRTTTDRAKVDHLMALVDQLETQLEASRATAANLLEALVAELTTQA